MLSQARILLVHCVPSLVVSGFLDTFVQFGDGHLLDSVLSVIDSGNFVIDFSAILLLIERFRFINL